MDFDTTIESITGVKDSVIELEKYIDNYRDRNRLYIISFVPPRTFNFDLLSTEEKESFVKNVLALFRATFGEKMKIFGRHIVVQGFGRDELEDLLNKIHNELNKRDLPLYIVVKDISSKDLDIQNAIQQIERSLFMPMCAPDCGLESSFIRFI